MCLLCPQVGPSQPSLQMQVKVSPPPTQVPPLEHGLEAHVLFLAGRGKESVSERERESKSLHNLLLLSSPNYHFTFSFSRESMLIWPSSAFLIPMEINFQ